MSWKCAILLYCISQHLIAVIERGQTDVEICSCILEIPGSLLLRLLVLMTGIS